MECQRILIIEKLTSTRTTLRERLLEQGYSVELADDAEQARQRIAAARPDVILLDLNISNPGGWEFLEQLKTGETTSGIPVLVFSDGSEPRRKFAGMFMSKKEQIEKLLRSLERICTEENAAEKLPEFLGDPSQEVFPGLMTTGSDSDEENQKERSS